MQMSLSCDVDDPPILYRLVLCMSRRILDNMIDVSKADMSLSDPSGLCNGLGGVPFKKRTRPWRFELGGRDKFSSNCVLR